MKVEILKIEPSNRPNVRAQVSVVLSGESFKIIINDVRVLQNRQGQLWVSMPTHSVQRNTGDVGFVPTVELNSLLNTEVCLCALAEFEKWNNARGNR
jgi:DNA-binding cell septation regulator SpoVG